jgi:PKD repeat protein
MKMTIKNKFGWGSLPIALFTALIMLVGCKEEYPAAGSIPDNTPPQANFSFAQLASDNYLEVTFTNLSTSSTDYLWDFGDGNTSTDFEPVHIYAAEGTYTVTLVSSDKLDVESTKVMEIELTEPAAYVPPILEPSFEDGQLTGATGDGRDSWRNSDIGGVIQITSSPVLTGTQAAKLTGDPGDKRIGYQLLTVSEDAVYDVSFYYTMKDNQVGSLTVAVLDGPATSHADALTKIIGATTVNDQSDPDTYVKETFSFYSDQNTEVALYFFNDGSVETRLDDFDITIGSGPAPVLANFTYAADTTDYMTIDFMSASVGEDSYAWDFGDGSTSTDMNPSHTYTADGTYTVQLTASNMAGGTDMISMDVTIAAPVAVAIRNPSFDSEPVKNDNRIVWRNESLETDADTYFGSSDYMLQITTSVNSGTYAGKLPTAENSSNPRRWLYQEVAVNQNTSYDITGYIRNKVSSVGSTVTFEIYDGPFSTASTIGDATRILSSMDFDATTGHDTSVYTPATINFNSGSNDTIVLFISNDYTLTATDSETMVDDVTIAEN